MPTTVMLHSNRFPLKTDAAIAGPNKMMTLIIIQRNNIVIFDPPMQIEHLWTIDMTRGGSIGNAVYGSNNGNVNDSMYSPKKKNGNGNVNLHKVMLPQ